MKKITTKTINDMVWDFKWEGALDEEALIERIEELLQKEKRLSELGKRISSVKENIKSIFDIDSGDDF